MATVKEQLEEAQRQLTSKDGELTRLRGQRGGAEEMIQFKADVVSTIMGLDCGCHDREDVLSELGLQPPTRDIQFSCTGRLALNYELDEKYGDPKNHPADWSEWLDDKLNLEDSDLYGHLDNGEAWDSDIECADTHVDGWTVEDVRFDSAGHCLKFVVEVSMHGVATLEADAGRPGGNLAEWLTESISEPQPANLDPTPYDEDDVTGWSFGNCTWSIHDAEWAD